MNESEYIVLYANCIPIKGVNKSIIYDLQRCIAIDIPNDLYNVIQKFPNHNLNSICNIMGEENKEIVIEYIDYLKDNDLVFFLNKEELSLFPKLNLDWDNSSIISNAIMDISPSTIISFKDSLDKIQELGCEHLSIVINVKDSFNALEKVLSELDRTSIYSLVVELTQDPDISLKQYEELISKDKRLQYLFIYTNKELKESDSRIIPCSNDEYKKKRANFFSINISMFTESQKHHTYFNRKLYIGGEGEIKNAPECEDTFGLIQDIKDVGDLKAIIALPRFQKYWFIHKELCSVCKHCEFRHMCIDNRLPIQSDTIPNHYIFDTECDIYS